MSPDFLAEFAFFAGVPDSQLRGLCAWLNDRYGISERHIIAANEGNAAALAAGYHLATGKTPVVYLQNSGLGNLINPAASLLHEQVYGIPCLFIVGWRGEPGVHDEPQHLFQGEVTLGLLEQMQIPAFVIGPETTQEQVQAKLAEYRQLFARGRQAAFVVRKGALEYEGRSKRHGLGRLSREEAVRCILAAAGEEDVFVSTTGMASRELFELREQAGQGHGRDFLTVGSMGHCSSIALGIALQQRGRRVWCIDGDGSMLMHMGAMAVIGASGPENLVHVVINNGAHESVGGMPTVAGQVDLAGVARSCGYAAADRAGTRDELEDRLHGIADSRMLSFLEVRAAVGARENLGRPTTTPQENKAVFMKNLARQEGTGAGAVRP